jgi:hypothetical protein
VEEVEGVSAHDDKYEDKEKEEKQTKITVRNLEEEDFLALSSNHSSNDDQQEPPKTPHKYSKSRIKCPREECNSEVLDMARHKRRVHNRVQQRTEQVLEDDTMWTNMKGHQAR